MSRAFLIRCMNSDAEIVSGQRFLHSAHCQTDDVEFGRDVASKEALAQLLNIADSRHQSRFALCNPLPGPDS